MVRWGGFSWQVVRFPPLPVTFGLEGGSLLSRGPGLTCGARAGSSRTRPGPKGTHLPEPARADVPSFPPFLSKRPPAPLPFVGILVRSPVPNVPLAVADRAGRASAGLMTRPGRQRHADGRAARQGRKEMGQAAGRFLPCSDGPPPRAAPIWSRGRREPTARAGASGTKDGDRRGGVGSRPPTPMREIKQGGGMRKVGGGG